MTNVFVFVAIDRKSLLVSLLTSKETLLIAKTELAPSCFHKQGVVAAKRAEGALGSGPTVTPILYTVMNGQSAPFVFTGIGTIARPSSGAPLSEEQLNAFMDGLRSV
jgi:hypothetical protein